MSDSRRLPSGGHDRRAETAARRVAADGYSAEDVLAAYDRDSAGRWFKRGEIVIASADAAVFATAARLGLAEGRHSRLASVGVDAATFVAPPNTDMEAAVAMLRAAFPDAAIDLNYIYFPQGQAAPQLQSGVSPPRPAPAATAAIIDGAIGHPPHAGVSLTTRRFIAGPPAANGHADAIAEILRRSANLQSLHLLVADVVSAGPIQAAAADDIARALDWTAIEGAGVINVSLTGPPSMTLALVVRTIAARGSIVVAAAGNDGPRAPAPHPAALPDVIGVTAVDDRGRVWRRAARGAHIDFAAHGVRVDGDRGLTGTSYATPVIAGVLARRLPHADTRLAPRAVRELESLARDLGAPGRDPVYGAGLIVAP